MIGASDNFDDKLAELRYRLRESEIKYKNLIDQKIFGLIIHDNERIKYINNIGLKILEYDCFEEIKNIPILDFVHKDYRKLVKSRQESLNSFEDRVDKVNIKFITKYNKKIDAEVVGSNIIFENKVCTQIIFRDITNEIVLSENINKIEMKYNKLFENSPLGLILTDFDGKIISLNPEGSNILKIKKEDKENYNILDFYINPEKREYLLEKIKKDGRITDEKVSIIDTLGNTKICKFNGIIIEKSFIQTFIQDISKEEDLEYQINMKDRIDIIGNLSAGLSHNFNNLLTTLLGNLELLKFSQLDEEQSEFIDNIETASRKASKIIKSLQTFNKNIIPRNEVFNLHHVVRDIINLLEDTTNKLIQKRNLLSKETIFIKGDPSEFNQIFMNLFINSIDAIESKKNVTSKDFISIKDQLIFLENNNIHKLKSGYYHKIIVSDTGCGIQPDIKERIFTPFFSSKKSGMGLGLVTVHRSIKRNLGEIYLESDVDKGTEFTILLPKFENYDISKNSFKVDCKTKVDNINKINKILIVDDEVSILSLIARSLKKKNIEFDTAINGLEGLELFKNNKYDFVILDISMPIMNGFTLIKEIQKRDPYFKNIIIITGYTDEDIDHELQKKICCIVPKPFSVNNLLDKLVISN